jgi:tRNA/rRNA methyltransferase
MGLSGLAVVNPVNCDLTRVLKMATHHAEDIVVDMEVYNSLGDALAPFQYVVGATARTGAQRQSVKDPRQLASELTGISRKNRIALLFGAESTGLPNEALRYCDALVTIPTARFSSINLAQAVMIVAYEIFLATGGKKEGFVPRLAARGELEGMYAQLTDTLVKINFINQENPDYWMMAVRRFFSRVGLRGRDVRLIRGICRQIDWYCFRRAGAEPAEKAKEK